MTVVKNNYNVFIIGNNNMDNIALNNSLNLFENKSLDEKFEKIYRNNFEKFRTWLIAKNSERYAIDVLSAFDKVLNLEFNEVVELRDKIQNHSSKRYMYYSIRNFTNFCDDYEFLEENIILKLKNKIKLDTRSRPDDYVPSSNEIQRTYNEVKENNNLWGLIMRISLESGLRFTEVQEFLKTYKKSRIEFIGSIGIYPLYSLKGNKNAYYVFLSKSTFEMILKVKDRDSWMFPGFDSFIRRQNLTSIKYLRKYNFTRLVRSKVPVEFANFVQGRVSRNIGFTTYLEKKETTIPYYRKLKLELKF